MKKTVLSTFLSIITASLLHANDNSKINQKTVFDSIVKSTKSAVNKSAMMGVWKYNHTIIVLNTGETKEETRGYYSKPTFDQFQMGSNSGGEITEIMKQQAYDKIVVEQRDKEGDGFFNLDASVMYNFMEFNNKRVMTVERKKDNIIEMLSGINSIYNIETDEKTKTTYLVIGQPDFNREKKYILLNLSEDQLLIADTQYSEFHFFNK